MDSLEWNEFNIKIPPLITVPVNISKNHMSKIIRFRGTIADMSDYFETQKELEKTAALLSRVIAKRKNSFRKMVGFKDVCKLNASLCRILRVNLCETLSNFHSILPEYVAEKNLLPSRNIIDHILTRFIGVYKIFERISDCCITSADFFSKLLRYCFFTDTNVLFLAILAKLWTISNEIGNKTAKYYQILLEHRDHFPESKNQRVLRFPELITELPNTKAFKQINVESTLPIKNKETKNVIHLNNTDLGTVINRVSLKPDYCESMEKTDIKNLSNNNSNAKTDSQKWNVIKSKKNIKKKNRDHSIPYKFAFNK